MPARVAEVPLGDGATLGAGVALGDCAALGSDEAPGAGVALGTAAALPAGVALGPCVTLGPTDDVGTTFTLPQDAATSSAATTRAEARREVGMPGDDGVRMSGPRCWGLPSAIIGGGTGSPQAAPGAPGPSPCRDVTNDERWTCFAGAVYSPRLPLH